MQVFVFLLDESCLRGLCARHQRVPYSLLGRYLLLATDLFTLLDSWGIGQQGMPAFRKGFCTRKLVTSFTYVWVGPT